MGRVQDYNLIPKLSITNYLSIEAHMSEAAWANN